jgi:hypothetical protein
MKNQNLPPISQTPQNNKAYTPLLQAKIGENTGNFTTSVSNFNGLIPLQNTATISMPTSSLSSVALISNPYTTNR